MLDVTKIQQLNLPWIDSPFFEELLAQSNLDDETKKQVKDFADYGYLIIDPEIPNFEQVANQIINNLKSCYIDPGRIQDAWKFNDDVKTIATAPKVISILRTLYQREPIPFQTLNFPKGTEQSTHSDAVHFHCVPAGFMAGVWVALEDIDANNGPLHYYPGSHKLPIFDLSNLGISGSYQEYPYEHYSVYEDLLQSLISHYKLEKVEVYIKKGQALIWAANLLHGGSPILDCSRSRHSQVTHYYFDNCLYYTPLLSDPFLKRIYLKEITNISTEKVVKHYYNGQEISMENQPEIKIEEQLEIKIEPQPEMLIPSNESQIDLLRFQLEQAESELEEKKFFINQVENSKFWKLRNKWFKLKKALGLVQKV